MKNLTIFLYEWKHFIRSPFKIIAVVLFVFASIYGLYNGSTLYQKQKAEVEKIAQKIKAERQKNITAYENGEITDENRPWIDLGNPYQAIQNTGLYHFKSPSPAMVYSLGQSEQYGFYKKITVWSSPYDADLAEEIANPERLQTGTLDFTFALLFLMPLVLLVLLYNIKSAETEQGFMPLIEVQSASNSFWLFSRFIFYIVLMALVILCLIVFGAFLTKVFSGSAKAIVQMILLSFAYLTLWSVLYFLILRKGKSISGNTLIMTGVYLLFAFIIPATVHQYLSIKMPANLMLDFIDADRDQKQKLLDEPDIILQSKLNKLYPQILDSPILIDLDKSKIARSRSASALVNELKKESVIEIEKENETKNAFIVSTFWFNPLSFFQNTFNSITKTHFNDYQAYRNDIQYLVDKQNELLVIDMWNDVKVDGEKYNYYLKELTK